MIKNSCVTNKLYEYVDKELSKRENFKLKQHINLCGSCKTELNEILKYKKSIKLIPQNELKFVRNSLIRINTRHTENYYQYIKAAAIITVLIFISAFYLKSKVTLNNQTAISNFISNKTKIQNQNITDIQDDELEIDNIGIQTNEDGFYDIKI